MCAEHVVPFRRFVLSLSLNIATLHSKTETEPKESPFNPAGPSDLLSSSPPAAVSRTSSVPRAGSPRAAWWVPTADHRYSPRHSPPPPPPAPQPPERRPAWAPLGQAPGCAFRAMWSWDAPSYHQRSATASDQGLQCSDQKTQQSVNKGGDKSQRQNNPKANKSSFSTLLMV